MPRLDGHLNRATAFFCVVMLGVALCVGLGGCKDSDAIKNYIYDQNAEKVDHNSGKTYAIPAEDGTFVARDTGVYQVSKGKKQKKLKVNVVYESEGAESTLPSAKFVYDANSTNNSEASEGVKKSTESTEQQEQNEQPQQDSTQKSQKSSSKKSNGDSNKGKSNSKNGNGTKKSGNKGGNKDGNNSGNDKDATVYDSTGEDPDLPDVSKVAAYGACAVVVQMLGGQDGSTPLVAADDALCSGSFASVFSDEGSSTITTAFTKKDEDYEPDIDAIIKSDPDTVFVYSDAYFTKAQKTKLAKADISITVVPRLTSATSILAAVRNISTMLDKVTGGVSTSRYEEYEDFHDDLVSDIQGRKGYGSYNGTYFDADAKSKSKTYEASKFSIIATDWDYNASYSLGSAITAGSSGVGLSITGYRWSPVSYYMGVGGVVNNTAAMFPSKMNDGELVPLWQFNPTQANPESVSYSKDFTRDFYENLQNGFTNTTLAAPNATKNTLNSKGLGTDTYPVVIFADQKMARAFKTSASKSNGLYHVFGIVETDIGSFQGTVYDGTEVFSAINADADVDSMCLVNPCGLFSDWISGSVESCLESAWIASQSVFDGELSESDLESEIRDFYTKFYRYDLKKDEVTKILNGAEG